MKKLLFALITSCILISSGCSDDDGDEGTKVLLFSTEDDKMLGQQLKQQIFNDTTGQFPLLDSVQYASAYAYIRALKDSVLKTGEVDYDDEFAWEVYIIQDDSTLNAFAAPGGYLYFYTGLIKYLDNEDDLMGVMGHEIAHADLRHSVQQLQKQYGIQFLLSALLGNSNSQVTQILGGLAGNAAVLKFSRDDETEADLASVEYLAPLAYRCDGAATFFKKLAAQGAGGGPTFLSTHPSPTDRVEAITQKALEIGCDTNYFAPSSYNTFVNSLP
ncbi:MAG: M48 family metalloprotease [Vicingaceae bacterium]